MFMRLIGIGERQIGKMSMTFEGLSQQETGLDKAKLDQEVKLYQNSREREEFNNRANLFLIIQTILALEIAYIKDAVSPQDYHQACLKLLEQSKAMLGLVKSSFAGEIEDFVKRYHRQNDSSLRLDYDHLTSLTCS